MITFNSLCRKELSLCHKLCFYNPYIFATKVVDQVAKVRLVKSLKTHFFISSTPNTSHKDVNNPIQFYFISTLQQNLKTLMGLLR